MLSYLYQRYCGVLGSDSEPSESLSIPSWTFMGQNTESCCQSVPAKVLLNANFNLPYCLVISYDEIWPAGLCFAVSFGGENTSFLFGQPKINHFHGWSDRNGGYLISWPIQLGKPSIHILKKQSNVWKFKFNSADLCLCFMIMSKMISDPEWSLKNTMLREERSS